MEDEPTAGTPGALKQQGRAARAVGRALSDNPHLDRLEEPQTSENMLTAWAERVAAWNEGWREADAELEGALFG